MDKKIAITKIKFKMFWFLYILAQKCCKYLVKKPS